MILKNDILLIQNKILSRLDMLFVSLAGVTIVTSALHFWPFRDSGLWQILNIPNFCCGISLATAALFLITKKYRSIVLNFIPDISVMSYLAINILSISFADGLSRPLSYTIKLGLVFIGGLFLFQKALTNPKALKLCYLFLVIAVSLSIINCILTRLFFDQKQFGFHGNVFKYGTYIGILVPLCSIYLLSGSTLQVLIATLIITFGMFSAGSAGACLAIFAGLITALVMIPKASIKLSIFLCILLATVALYVSNKTFDGAITRDFIIKEDDGINLRQRYIEWQAEINLLEKRGIIGTVAGCVNDYRSHFYYRLPKLNTLRACDQNGFLAVGAETGLLGLVAFIWILINYGKMSFQDCLYLQANRNSQVGAMATANTAAFISAITANFFSSVHYNGILIIFVFLLSLISSVRNTYRDNTDET